MADLFIQDGPRFMVGISKQQIVFPSDFGCGLWSIDHGLFPYPKFRLNADSSPDRHASIFSSSTPMEFSSVLISSIAYASKKVLRFSSCRSSTSLSFDLKNWLISAINCRQVPFVRKSSLLCLLKLLNKGKIFNTAWMSKIKAGLSIFCPACFAGVLFLLNQLSKLCSEGLLCACQRSRQRL